MVTVMFSSLAMGAGSAWAQDIDQQITQWVDAARAGRTADALAGLRALVARHPDSQRAVGDLVVVANWAEAHDEALNLYARIQAHAPAYVTAAAALSARRTQQFELAETLYRKLLVTTPDDRVAQAGVVLSRLGAEPDRGGSAADRSEEAAALALGWLPRERNARARREWVPLLEALAIVRERQRRHSEALTLWQTLLQAAPDSAAARRAIVFVASRLGAASTAESVAAGISAGIDDAARLRLRQDGTATAVRWGEAQAQVDPAAARFGWTDRALASNELDRRLAPPGSPLAANADFDRLVALRDRVRMVEVIALYRQLLREGKPVPDYALAAAADAYLYERQPDVARDLYRGAIESAIRLSGKPPQEWQFSLLWALLECEAWRDARALVEQLWQDRRSATRRVDPEPADFAAFTRVSVVRALVRLYADELRPAHTLLADLRDLAPHNPAIRAAYAASLQANGRRFANNELLRQTLADDPDYLTARIALADSEYELSRFASARAEVERLQRDYPENRAVQRAADTQAMHAAPELRLSTSLGAPRGDRNGDGVRHHEWRLEAHAYSAPLRDHYRLYAHLFAAHADGAGVTASARRDRAGIGIETRNEGVDASVELHGDLQPERRAGLALQLSIWPSDRWRARVTYDSNTLDIPLRATQTGVHAQQLSLDGTLQFNYLRSAALAYNGYRFSDGNARHSLSAAWRQRLVEGPQYRLDARVDAYASSNTRSDVAYFSPRRDRSLDVTLVNEWRTWRFYESSLTQRLALSAGEYWQAGHGALPALAVRYEHEWEVQRHYTLRYGIGWARRPYDGRQETRSSAFIDIAWRLR